MRDFAWASVKLFAPAAGAPGLLALGLATAGVLALGFAEGAMVCANAPPAPTRTVMTAVAKKGRRKSSCILYLMPSCWLAVRRAGLIPLAVGSRCSNRMMRV